MNLLRSNLAFGCLFLLSLTPALSARLDGNDGQQPGGSPLGPRVYKQQVGDGYYGPYDAGTYYTAAPDRKHHHHHHRHRHSADGSSQSSQPAAPAADDAISAAEAAAQRAQEQLEQARNMLQAAEEAKSRAQQAAQADKSNGSPQALPGEPQAPQPALLAVPQAAAAAPADNTESQIASLEQRLFSRTYDTDTDYNRLSRIEQFVFGKPRPDAEAKRLATLIEALQPGAAAEPPAGSSKPVPAPTFAALMKEGRSEFAQRAYHAARDTFDQAMVLNAQSQDAHFWLAMADWHLYDYDNTRSQLQIVFRLSPFTREGQVAKKQMLDIAQYLANKQRAPVDPPSVVRQAINDIQGQALDAQGQMLDSGELMAEQRERQAGWEAFRIQQSTDNYTASQWAQGNYYGYQPSNMGEVSDLGAIRSNYVYMDGMRQAEMARIDAAQRAASTQGWADSLYSQLGQPYLPGDPHLRALGTNLYVQYYGDDDPFNPTPVAPVDSPLLAKALSFRSLPLAAPVRAAVANSKR